MIRRAAVTAVVLAACAFATATRASAQTGWGIAVQPNGTIFFCDRSHNTVWRITPDGQRTTAADAVTCRAIVPGPNGTVTGESTPSDVTAAHGVGLWQIDARGARQWLMPPTRNPDPGRWLIRDAQEQELAWAGIAAGSARSEITLRDAFGGIVAIVGGARGQQDGAGRNAALGTIAGMALAPDGSIVLADSGNIRRVSPLHIVRTEAVGVVTDSRLGLINVPGLWGRELGVATDATGAAVVVDPEAGRIVHIDRRGHATPIWEPAGFPQRISGGRWGWRPTGVAMMGRSYYVLDEWMGPALIADLIGSPRLSQVDADGTVTRIASIADWTVRAAGAALMVVLLSALWMRGSRRRAARATSAAGENR